MIDGLFGIQGKMDQLVGNYTSMQAITKLGKCKQNAFY